LASLLGVTPAPLNLSMVVLLCSIAFSLSVDYEIFLLSRIKEARDSGLSNDAATVIGLGRVGRIISSAAMLLTITLFSFASGLSFMKMFGIGTALAVVIDATIIRAVVVPAFLKLAGDLNWWAPAPLRWLHTKIGISEAPSDHGSSAPAADPVLARQLAEVAHMTTMSERTSPPREVEIIPGRHLVANVNGTVIVVAHMDRAPLSQYSAAAQQLAALVDMITRTGAKTLAHAFSELTRQTTFTRTLVDVGIIMPTADGLELLLSGNVTMVLDDGVVQTVLRGFGRLEHKSVPVPGVAAVVTVDEPGRPPFTPTQRNGVYTLTGGTVPGQGAVIWSQPAGKAPANLPALIPAQSRPVAPAPVAALPPAPVVVAAPQKRWVVLDDNTRFEIDQDLLIGRDPDKSNGLRPIRIDDVTGEMSRSHMEVRIFNGEVVITDRNSSNGSFVRDQAQQGWSKLAPWSSVKWQPGTAVKIGGRTLRLEVTAGPPAQRPRVDVPHGPRGPVYAAACANIPRV
jgi:RND superfamily putative drug exporter